MARQGFFWLILLLIMPAFACTMPEIGGVTAPSASPTPMGDTLTFSVPLFTTSLEPGQKVPGADLQFVSANNGEFAVKIGGLDATRRAGDSFAWRGVIAPSVIGNYNLRITPNLTNRLGATGPVNVTIFNPTPALHPDFATATSSNTYRFSNIAVSYLVPTGVQVPGTDLIYAGTIEPGNTNNFVQTMVELRNNDNIYPYNAIGDSVVWQGQLQPNVFVRQSLRIVQIEEYGVRLIGTAELWINQSR
jgi:hypothetical protein